MTKKLQSYANVSFRHPQVNDVTEHDTIEDRIAWTVLEATS